MDQPFQRTWELRFLPNCPTLNLKAKTRIMKRLNPITLALATTFAQAALAPQTQAASAAKSEPIPTDQIGSVAGKQYSGDGLAVAATPNGARLRCVFQRLEG